MNRPIWANAFHNKRKLTGLGLFAPTRSVRAEVVCQGDVQTGFVCKEQGSVCTGNCGQDFSEQRLKNVF
jgi:hypothetical protein